jgi:hypothetical protein
VQNEPNFAQRGLAPEGKHAKRTQFVGRRPQDCGLVIADCGLKEATRRRVAEAECAKRTQLGAGGPRLRIGD